MEMYEVAHSLASKATSVLFLRNSNMQTLSQSELLVPQINTVYLGQDSIRYVRPIIWNSFPLTFRNIDSFLDSRFWLKIGNQQTAPVGYAKTIFLILAC